MSIRAHVRKLKPISEDFENPVDKLQNFLTEQKLKAEDYEAAIVVGWHKINNMKLNPSSSGISPKVMTLLEKNPLALESGEKIANEILKSLNLRNKGVKIISCPSCARQGFDVIKTVKILEEKLSHIKTPMTLSIIGCVVNGPGEAAFTDLISGGRLEFGIGSGAYQREFDRMFPGLKQTDGWRDMQESLPAVKALWQGDYEHEGQFWSFPKSTSVPKPIQSPHPPIWVAARAPITYDFAVENECNIMSWPLTRPMSEAELYKSRLDEAMGKFPNKPKPIPKNNMVHIKDCDI